MACASSIENFVSVIPFFRFHIELKVEFPKYLATAEDISPQMDKLKWWKKHEHGLPHWSQACRNVLLVQPSSAAAERVFCLIVLLTDKYKHWRTTLKLQFY